MSKYSIEETTLAGIADKVRTLRGINGVITPEEMAAQIQAKADSGKIVPETCTVTFQPSNSYFDLSHFPGKIYYMDDTMQLREHSMYDGFSVTVGKGSIMYVGSDSLWPVRDYSGQYYSVLTDFSNRFVIGITGDVTITIDYD